MTAIRNHFALFLAIDQVVQVLPTRKTKHGKQSNSLAQCHTQALPQIILTKELQFSTRSDQFKRRRGLKCFCRCADFTFESHRQNTTWNGYRSKSSGFQNFDHWAVKIHCSIDSTHIRVRALVNLVDPPRKGKTLCSMNKICSLLVEKNLFFWRPKLTRACMRNKNKK